MADLKYFISESQRFRAGDGYVEGGMMGVGGMGGGEGVFCISALCSNNGPNAVDFRRQQNGMGLKG